MKLQSLFFLIIFPVVVKAQLLTETAYFGTNPGNLTMYSYSPSFLAKDAKRPLVVVLH